MADKSNQNFEEDPELEAMRKVFAALRDLDSEAQNRVMDYVERRLDLEHSQTRASSRKNSAQGPLEHRPEQEQRLDDDEERKGLAEEDVVEEEDTGGLEGISPVAKKWMQRNGLSAARMSALYTLGVDEIDLVARKVPGKSGRERLHNVLLLQGIASYLSSGAPRIDNAKLSEAARHYDCDAGRNFSHYLKSWAAEVSGSRSAADLTLTTRGLNSAKDIIKQMTTEGST